MVAFKQILLSLSLCSTALGAYWRVELKNAEFSSTLSSVAPVATPDTVPVSPSTPDNEPAPESEAPPAEASTDSDDAPPAFSQKLSSTSGAASILPTTPLALTLLGSLSIACVQLF